MGEATFLEIVSSLRATAEEREQQRSRAVASSALARDPGILLPRTPRLRKVPEVFSFPITLQCVAPSATAASRGAEKTSPRSLAPRRTTDAYGPRRICHLDNGRRAASEETSVRLSTHFKRLAGQKG